ncbi:MAG: family 43 glycosylhydrolase, partial [Haliscomenobacter sp.]|nr:family 43 glycosylhydrolase [Haliscomenobacter sp.]
MGLLLFITLLSPSRSPLPIPFLKDSADPSIVKVGPDCYLIGPRFPISLVFRISAKDLKNWKQIGNVIHQPSFRWISWANA